MSDILSLDGGILLFLQNHVRGEAWNPLWIFITSLGNGGIVWIAASLLLLIPRRTRDIGAAALLSMGICALCTNVVLKNWAARVRPYEAVAGLTALIPHPRDFSFPSGHTTASFACALVLARYLPRRYGVPALVLAALIAFSRLYVGVHYPTDILGGILIAAAGSFLAIWVMNLKRPKISGEPPEP